MAPLLQQCADEKLQVCIARYLTPSTISAIDMLKAFDRFAKLIFSSIRIRSNSIALLFSKLCSKASIGLLNVFGARLSSAELVPLVTSLLTTGNFAPAWALLRSNKSQLPPNSSSHPSFGWLLVLKNPSVQSAINILLRSSEISSTFAATFYLRSRNSAEATKAADATAIAISIKVVSNAILWKVLDSLSLLTAALQSQPSLATLICSFLVEDSASATACTGVYFLKQKQHSLARRCLDLCATLPAPTNFILSASEAEGRLFANMAHRKGTDFVSCVFSFALSFFSFFRDSNFSVF